MALWVPRLLHQKTKNDRRKKSRNNKTVRMIEIFEHTGFPAAMNCWSWSFIDKSLRSFPNRVIPVVGLKTSEHDRNEKLGKANYHWLTCLSVLLILAASSRHGSGSKTEWHLHRRSYYRWFNEQQRQFLIRNVERHVTASGLWDSENEKKIMTVRIEQ